MGKEEGRGEGGETSASEESVLSVAHLDSPVPLLKKNRRKRESHKERLVQKRKKEEGSAHA